MLNKDMEVTTSNNGHYAMNILPDKTCNFDNIEQVLISKKMKVIKVKYRKLLDYINNLVMLLQEI